MIGMRILMEEQQATVKKLAHITGQMEKAVYRAAGQEAHLLRTMMVKGIRMQRPGGKKFKPLAPATIAARKGGGSTKALIDDGDMIRSIKVVPLFGGEVFFVGIHKTAVDKKGNVLANIAEVHEFGTKDKRIPARPFMRPSFAVWKKGVEARMTARLVDLLGFSKLAAIGQGTKGLLLTNTNREQQRESGKFVSTFTGDVSISFKGGRAKFKV